MIDKQEFYRRFCEIKPGADISKNGPEGNSADIYFESLSMIGLEEMHNYSIDERLYEFFEFKPFTNIEETKTYLEKLLRRMTGEMEERTYVYWFVRRKSDNRLIGTACLVNLNYGRQSVEWGYGVDPELWGSGYILQMQEILKQYAFEVLELNRLDGVTMIHNERTISSLLAAGMKHEGTLREFYCKDEVFYDGWKYAMLQKEYLELKKEQSPSNELITIESVIELIQSVLDEEIVDEGSDIKNTSTWDSLSHMMIIVAVFNRYGFQFTPNQVAKATSVREIFQIINK
jgi:ribosomal-protein-alanine N-acetyltransferase